MAQRHDAAMIFDLDGTLADSVYQHVMAWDTTLRANGIELSVWRIHRRIGMSGGLFVRALGRELGHDLDPAVVATLQRGHSEAYERLVEGVRPLPGARELLATLTEQGVPWAIATSGSREVAARTLRILAVPDEVPVVTRTDVAHAKPNPDLFLEAARRLNVDPGSAFVVGDSVWDLLAAQRAGSLGIGVLSGGYGNDELQQAGAYRVYADPADLLLHLDELGIRLASEAGRTPGL
jgi:HAD superfamily hydrolase (TIGR01509 family)